MAGALPCTAGFGLAAGVRSECLALAYLAARDASDPAARDASDRTALYITQARGPAELSFPRFEER